MSSLTPAVGPAVVLTVGPDVVPHTSSRPPLRSPMVGPVLVLPCACWLGSLWFDKSGITQHHGAALPSLGPITSLRSSWRVGPGLSHCEWAPVVSLF